MKCPSCGDTQRQQRLRPPDDGSIGYRCGQCGRLYQVPIMDLPQILDRLEQLKASADVLARQQAEFAQSVADIEEQVRAAQVESGG